MPYEDATHIPVRKSTKNKAREAKDELGLTYDEFLERATENINELKE